MKAFPRFENVFVWFCMERKLNQRSVFGSVEGPRSSSILSLPFLAYLVYF